MTTISIDKKTKKMLEAFSGRDYKEKFDNMIRESIRAKIKECNELIANFEAKYRVEFEEFEKLWNEGKIEDKHAHEIEKDFIEWEALEMEKDEWLRFLREDLNGND